MSEDNYEEPKGDRQDPAESNQVDTSVETNTQPDESADEPADASAPVEVAPKEAPGLLVNFEVSPERGYRLRREV